MAIAIVLVRFYSHVFGQMAGRGQKLSWLADRPGTQATFI